jgi:signal transduction histidine kinase
MAHGLLYGSCRGPQTHRVERQQGLSDRSRWGLVLAGALGVMVGIAAEGMSSGLTDPVPDLIVGWACIGSGLLAAYRRPGSRTGPLIALTGFAWFLYNFSAVPVALLAIVAAQLTLLHRAVLVHAALTLPTGRTHGWPERGVIAVAYAAWSIPATAGSALVTAGLSAAIVAVALAQLRSGPTPARRTRLVALGAAILLGAAFTFTSIVHAADPTDPVALLVDEATIVVVAVGLAAATLRPGWEAGRMTDLVVEVARRRAGHVRDILATAVGDPSLEVGYWHDASGSYLDSSGEPVTPPGAGDPRTATRVDTGGQPMAMLVHDQAVLEGSALSAAVDTAATLAAANVRLRGDVLDQLSDLRASRQRLLLAEDGERRRLERRLNGGPMRRAERLAGNLDELDSIATDSGDLEAAEHLRRARVALDDVGVDLDQLAQGLHPVAITTAGLAASLRSLADKSSLPVVVDCRAEALPEPIELAIYYACAEAVANAAKHARATSVSILVERRDSQARLMVTDDGAGGADPAAGTGLRGVQDRIEALGGHVSIRSEAGVGTGLRADIPLPMLPDGGGVRSGRPSAARGSPRP